MTPKTQVPSQPADDYDTIAIDITSAPEGRRDDWFLLIGTHAQRWRALGIQGLEVLRRDAAACMIILRWPRRFFAHRFERRLYVYLQELRCPGHDDYLQQIAEAPNEFLLVRVLRRRKGSFTKKRERPPDVGSPKEKRRKSAQS